MTTLAESEDLPGAEAAAPSLTRRVAGQGALLLGGYAASQGLSFARNAVLGHALSKGDFGIAATLTMMLQLTEMLSDLGADRLIVQDPDGEEARLAATVQGVLVLRGFATGLVLVMAAPLMAAFFSIAEAAPAFALAALVPLIKGFMHLDMRLAQRRLDNRPQMAAEVLPQAAALLALWPLLAWRASYEVVVWLGIAQAMIAVAVTHVVAARRYRLALDRDVLRRVMVFGWPIWASAFPLIAVYQGDRIIVGRLMGMEALAGYSAAFMVAMVPGLLAAKVGNALMLPVLAGAERGSEEQARRFGLVCDATALAAGLYLAGFVLAGGPVLAFVFGHQYAGLGPLVSWLALMWALRMMQAVAGVLLMAVGETKPLLTAGVIRALALGPAFLIAALGYGVEAVAAAGCVGEVASLAFVAWAIERVRPGMAREMLSRAWLTGGAGLLALVILPGVTGAQKLWPALTAAAAAGALISMLALIVMPRLWDSAKKLV